MNDVYAWINIILHMSILLTSPKMALYPPPLHTHTIGVQISLYKNKLRLVEGDSLSPKGEVYSADKFSSQTRKCFELLERVKRV